MTRTLILLAILTASIGLYIDQQVEKSNQQVPSRPALNNQTDTSASHSQKNNPDEEESQTGSAMEAVLNSYELPPPQQIELIRLLRKKDFVLLENTIQRYVDEFSENVVYEGKVIDAFNTFGFEPNILEELNEWHQAFPDSAFPRLARGAAYRQLGWDARGGGYSSQTNDEQFISMRHYFNLADEEYIDALNINPKLSPAYCGLIDMAAARSMKYDKSKWYLKGTSEIPASYNIRWCYFHKLLPQWGGSFQEMELFVTRAMQHYDDNPRVMLLQPYYLYFLAKSYAANGFYEQAITEMTKSIQHTKRWYNFHARGKYYKHVGEYELALADMESANAARPDAYGPLKEKILILKSLGRLEEALELSNHGVSIYPNHHTLYNYRGLVHWNLKDYESAYKDYSAALELNPNSAYAWKQKGVLNHYYLNNSDQAIADLSKAVSLDSSPGTVYAYAGVLFHTKHPSAIPVFKSYLALCESKSCDTKNRIFATKLLACVNKQPSCTWDPDSYSTWVTN